MGWVQPPTRFLLNNSGGVMSFGRTNSLSVIGVTQLGLATFLRSFARDSLPKQKYGCEKQVYPQKGVGDICFIGEALEMFRGSPPRSVNYEIRVYWRLTLRVI